MEQDLITTTDLRNSSNMLTQHLSKNKSEPGVPLSLKIRKQNLKKNLCGREYTQLLGCHRGV